MESSKLKDLTSDNQDMDKIMSELTSFLIEERELRRNSEERIERLHREVLEIKSDLRIIMGSVSVEKMDKRDEKVREIELQQEILKGIINTMDANNIATKTSMSDILRSIERINERLASIEIVKKLSESEISNIKSREEKRDKIQKELVSKVSDILIKVAGLGAATYLGVKEIIN